LYRKAGVPWGVDHLPLLVNQAQPRPASTPMGSSLCCDLRADLQLRTLCVLRGEGRNSSRFQVLFMHPEKVINVSRIGSL